MQPSFHNITIHYQEKVSNLLKFLLANDVIEDVDPSEINDCFRNVVITEKTSGDIKMNIENTPINPGMLRTKYHIQTPQEIRHDLKVATIFMKCTWGGDYTKYYSKRTLKKKVFSRHMKASTV